MPTTPLGRPTSEEFGPYYERYISLVPTDDLVTYMTGQIGEFQSALAALSDAEANSTYAPGKWTVKEVVGHLIDTERVFQYRALSIARVDPAVLASFDQEVWAAHAESGSRALEELLAEWTLVRRANIAFIQSLPAAAVLRTGRAADNTMSVRALCYVPPGHLAYHLRILRERYLV
jgi:hypothetical protein